MEAQVVVNTYVKGKNYVLEDLLVDSEDNGITSLRVLS